MSAPEINLLEACADDELFGRHFKDPSTFAAWFAFIAAFFALPMTAEQLAIYQAYTGRAVAPASPFTEGWLICGRRSGKSFVLALIAVFLACFKSYSEYLGPGERATIIIIAADRKQARQIYRYIRGLITHTPMLSTLLQGQPRADGLDLTNMVSIEIGTASFRTSRGYTFAAVLCDELAFFPTDDSAQPDYAVLDALRPGTATIPGAVMLCASSPYARRGALYDAYKRYFGQDDAEVLVWKAATREMNPTVPQSIIDRATERNPASAAAEYGAEFRSDLEAFLSLELIEAAIDQNVVVRAPLPLGAVRYFAFADPSGGVGDAAALAIAHKEGERIILDCLCEYPVPHNPATVAAMMSATLKSYGLRDVTGDRYAAQWVVQAFAANGITYRHSERDRSAIYLEAMPLFSTGRACLLYNARLINQLASLERRPSATRDRINHPPGGHDDLANAACGALALAADKARAVHAGAIIVSSGAPTIPGSEPLDYRQRVWERLMRDGPTEGGGFP